MSTRRKTVSATINEDNTAVTFKLYTRPDDAGNQSVAETVSVTLDDIAPRYRDYFILLGFNTLFSNRYNRLDNPDATDTCKCFDDFASAVRDGTWEPGTRAVGDSEPDDIVVAIAEATGQPVHVIQDRIDNELQKNPDGTPRVDKRGRNMRVFNAAMLAKIADDPKVKPILARLSAERAKRLTAEAKAQAASGAQSSMLDTFGGTTLQAEAAQ